LAPTPNPQSPIPNPQSPFYIYLIIGLYLLIEILIDYNCYNQKIIKIINL
jgi:hypothetical protein